MEAKKFLIVGGSKGIGRSLVDRLAVDGNFVISISRTGEPFGAPPNVTIINTDVISDYLPDIDGPLSGLAYCPGTINLKPFQRLTDEDFQNDLDVNLFGAIRTIRHYLPHLKMSESASVVLFSTVAVGAGMGFHASIAASKGAVEGLTRSLAAELAPAIRFNCIAPSLTLTPLAERLTNTPEKIQASAARHPLKRIGQPEDIAEMAAFLLTARSAWITGQVINVDGGIGDLR